MEFYKKACRLCLLVEGTMLGLYDLLHPTYTPSLAEKIWDCVAIKVSADDGLPRHICYRCVVQLENCHDFKAKCQRADSQLRSVKMLELKTEDTSPALPVEDDDGGFLLSEDEDVLKVDPDLSSEIEISLKQLKCRRLKPAPVDSSTQCRNVGSEVRATGIVGSIQKPGEKCRDDGPFPTADRTMQPVVLLEALDESIITRHMRGVTGCRGKMGPRRRVGNIGKRKGPKEKIAIQVEEENVERKKDRRRSASVEGPIYTEASQRYVTIGNNIADIHVYDITNTRIIMDVNSPSKAKTRHENESNKSITENLHDVSTGTELYVQESNASLGNEPVFQDVESDISNKCTLQNTFPQSRDCNSTKPNMCREVEVDKVSCEGRDTKMCKDTGDLNIDRDELGNDDVTPPRMANQSEGELDKRDDPRDSGQTVNVNTASVAPLSIAHRTRTRRRSKTCTEQQDLNCSRCHNLEDLEEILSNLGTQDTNLCPHTGMPVPCRIENTEIEATMERIHFIGRNEVETLTGIVDKEMKPVTRCDGVNGELVRKTDEEVSDSDKDRDTEEGSCQRLSDYGESPSDVRDSIRRGQHLGDASSRQGELGDPDALLVSQRTNDVETGSGVVSEEDPCHCGAVEVNSTAGDTVSWITVGSIESIGDSQTVIVTGIGDSENEGGPPPEDLDKRVGDWVTQATSHMWPRPCEATPTVDRAASREQRTRDGFVSARTLPFRQVRLWAKVSNQLMTSMMGEESLRPFKRKRRWKYGESETVIDRVNIDLENDGTREISETHGSNTECDKPNKEGPVDVSNAHETTSHAEIKSVDKPLDEPQIRFPNGRIITKVDKCGENDRTRVLSVDENQAFPNSVHSYIESSKEVTQLNTLSTESNEILPVKNKEKIKQQLNLGKKCTNSIYSHDKPSISNEHQTNLMDLINYKVFQAPQEKNISERDPTQNISTSNENLISAVIEGKDREIPATTRDRDDTDRADVSTCGIGASISLSVDTEYDEDRQLSNDIYRKEKTHLHEKQTESNVVKEREEQLTSIQNRHGFNQNMDPEEVDALHVASPTKDIQNSPESVVNITENVCDGSVPINSSPEDGSVANDVGNGITFENMQTTHDDRSLKSSDHCVRVTEQSGCRTALEVGGEKSDSPSEITAANAEESVSSDVASAANIGESQPEETSTKFFGGRTTRNLKEGVVKKKKKMCWRNPKLTLKHQKPVMSLTKEQVVEMANSQLNTIFDPHNGGGCIYRGTSPEATPQEGVAKFIRKGALEKHNSNRNKLITAKVVQAMSKFLSRVPSPESRTKGLNPSFDSLKDKVISRIQARNPPDLSKRGVSFVWPSPRDSSLTNSQRETQGTGNWSPGSRGATSGHPTQDGQNKRVVVPKQQVGCDGATQTPWRAGSFNKPLAMADRQTQGRSRRNDLLPENEKTTQTGFRLEWNPPMKGFTIPRKPSKSEDSIDIELSNKKSNLLGPNHISSIDSKNRNILKKRTSSKELRKEKITPSSMVKEANAMNLMKRTERQSKSKDPCPKPAGVDSPKPNKSRSNTDSENVKMSVTEGFELESKHNSKSLSASEKNKKIILDSSSHASTKISKYVKLKENLEKTVSKRKSSELSDSLPDTEHKDMPLRSQQTKTSSKRPVSLQWIKSLELSGSPSKRAGVSTIADLKGENGTLMNANLDREDPSSTSSNSKISKYKQANRTPNNKQLSGTEVPITAVIYHSGSPTTDRALKPISLDHRRQSFSGAGDIPRNSQESGVSVKDHSNSPTTDTPLKPNSRDPRRQSSSGAGDSPRDSQEGGVSVKDHSGSPTTDTPLKPNSRDPRRQSSVGAGDSPLESHRSQWSLGSDSWSSPSTSQLQLKARHTPHDDGVNDSSIAPNSQHRSQCYGSQTISHNVTTSSKQISNLNEGFNETVFPPPTRSDQLQRESINVQPMAMNEQHARFLNERVSRPIQGHSYPGPAGERPSGPTSEPPAAMQSTYVHPSTGSYPVQRNLPFNAHQNSSTIDTCNAVFSQQVYPIRGPFDGNRETWNRFNGNQNSQCSSSRVHRMHNFHAEAPGSPNSNVGFRDQPPQPGNWMSTASQNMHGDGNYNGFYGQNTPSRNNWAHCRPTRINRRTRLPHAGYCGFQTWDSMNHVPSNDGSTTHHIQGTEQMRKNMYDANNDNTQPEESTARPSPNSTINTTSQWAATNDALKPTVQRQKSSGDTQDGTQNHVQQTVKKTTRNNPQTCDEKGAIADKQHSPQDKSHSSRQDSGCVASSNPTPPESGQGEQQVSNKNDRSNEHSQDKAEKIVERNVNVKNSGARKDTVEKPKGESHPRKKQVSTPVIEKVRVSSEDAGCSRVGELPPRAHECDSALTSTQTEHGEVSGQATRPQTGGETPRNQKSSGHKREAGTPPSSGKTTATKRTKDSTRVDVKKPKVFPIDSNVNEESKRDTKIKSSAKIASSKPTKGTKDRHSRVDNDDGDAVSMSNRRSASPYYFTKSPVNYHENSRHNDRINDSPWKRCNSLSNFSSNEANEESHKEAFDRNERQYGSFDIIERDRERRSFYNPNFSRGSGFYRGGRSSFVTRGRGRSYHTLQSRGGVWSGRSGPHRRGIAEREVSHPRHEAVEPRDRLSSRSQDRDWHCNSSGTGGAGRYRSPSVEKTGGPDRTASRPRYESEEGGPQFPSRYKLVNHTNVHEGSRPHVCSTCGQGFYKRWSLAVHEEQTHHMKRPHKCHICPVSYRNVTLLRRHVRMHLGQKPFGCNVCHLRFLDKVQLIRHLASNHITKEELEDEDFDLEALIHFDSSVRKVEPTRH